MVTGYFVDIIFDVPQDHPPIKLYWNDKLIEECDVNLVEGSEHYGKISFCLHLNKIGESVKNMTEDELFTKIRWEGYYNTLKPDVEFYTFNFDVY